MADQGTNKPPNPRARRTGDRRLTSRTPPGSAMWYVLGFLLLLALGQAFFFSMQSGETIPYSDFKTLLREGHVQEVTVAEDRVRGILKPEARGHASCFTPVSI